MTHIREAAPSGHPRYSPVIPIFNEAAVLPLLIRRVKALLDQLDGNLRRRSSSTTAATTQSYLLAEIAAPDPRVRVLRLSRNFGHQIAVTAGIDAATGAP